MSISITEKLGHLRAEKGWNRSEAARQSEIPISTYQAYEKLNRKPKGEAAIKIARAFGVTVDYLLDDSKGYPPGPLDRASYTKPRKLTTQEGEAIDLSPLTEDFRRYFQAHPDKLIGLAQKDIEELSSIRGYGGAPSDPEYWITRHIEENNALDRCKHILVGPNRALLLSILESFDKSQ
ncbi:MAG: helix-turn-helix domain-containing protein [Candidatus Brocadiales bacterium]